MVEITVKSTREIFKYIFDFFQFWKRLIITAGIVLYAIVVDIKFLSIKSQIDSEIVYKILLTSLGFFLLSFIIFKMFPHRFLNWDLKKIKNIMDIKEDWGWKFFVLIFASPLANLLMSLSLSCYIFSLINPNLKYVLIGEEAIYDLLSRFSAGFIFLVIFSALNFVVIYSLIFLLIKRRSSSSDIVLKPHNTKPHLQIIIVIFMLLILILIPLTISSLVEKLINLDQAFEMLSRFLLPLIRLIVGFMPLGWFYELFIGSIWKGER